MSNQYDVAVIGGGPIGLSSAYRCAKAGKSVLLLERFNFFNQSGSSNDMVRMFRTMYTQDFMANLAFQSIGAWRELEADAGQALIWMTRMRRSRISG
jgi:sarcosine oxidase/L-pipecolate oxidase